jgi:hypothetical protein
MDPPVLSTSKMDRSTETLAFGARVFPAWFTVRVADLLSTHTFTSPVLGDENEFG